MPTGFVLNNNNNNNNNATLNVPFLQGYGIMMSLLITWETIRTESLEKIKFNFGVKSVVKSGINWFRLELIPRLNT